MTIVLSFILFDFIEVETATNWTIKYFAIPILFIMMPSCYIIYIKFIRQHEKLNKSNFWTQLRTIFRVFALTLAMTGMFIGTTLSLIILTNAYIGESRIILLNAKIVDYYTLKSKGRTKHYIKIQDKQINRIIDLKVPVKYNVGQTFKKQMKIGKWGLIYSMK